MTDKERMMYEFGRRQAREQEAYRRGFEDGMREIQQEGMFKLHRDHLRYGDGIHDVFGNPVFVCRVKI